MSKFTYHVEASTMVGTFTDAHSCVSWLRHSCGYLMYKTGSQLEATAQGLWEKGCRMEFTNKSGTIKVVITHEG